MIEEVRERLANYGTNSLSNRDLLRLAVGEEQANALFAFFGDIYTIYRATPQELMQVEGVGRAKAERLHAALAIGARAINLKSAKPAKIGGSQDAYELLTPYLRGLDVEEFWLILMNRSNSVIECKQISRGGIAGTVADPKMIFNAAILAKASAMILAHNHPSGNFKPSEADVKLTKKLKASGEMLEIAVLDHIIYTDDCYFSFTDEGMM